LKYPRRDFTSLPARQTYTVHILTGNEEGQVVRGVGDR